MLLVPIGQKPGAKVSNGTMHDERKRYYNSAVSGSHRVKVLCMFGGNDNER